MPTLLVAGCGYVGNCLARKASEAGWDVTGLTATEASARALQEEPYQAVACNIGDRNALQECLGRHGPFDLIIHCASSGRGGEEAYRAVYLEGTVNLLTLRPRRYIFTSSTSVYAQTDGSVVTEESEANPARETGRILRAAESETLAQEGVVARLSGIYGPGRSFILRKFFEGSAVIEGGGRYVNQIHRADAAGALLFLGESENTGIFNVSDDEPVSQPELYRWLAERFDREIPPEAPVDHERKRGWTNKQVSNAKLRNAGWEPTYPSFRHAVENDPGLLDPYES